MKPIINSGTKIAKLLLFNIGLLMSFSIFAAPEGLGADGAPAPARSATVYTLNDTLLDTGIVYIFNDSTKEHGLAIWRIDESTKLDWYAAKEATEAHGSGWRLPTKTELNLLYEAKIAESNVVGGFTAAPYWSSTENDGRYAWSQIFTSGTQKNSAKYDALKVRAVRSF